MLYYFLFPLKSHYRVFNLFGYISFRAIGAAATSLILSFVIGPIVIRALRRQSVNQVVREGTPATHAYKSSTPTMGGLIIIASTLISLALWARFGPEHYVWVAVFVMLWMGGIGVIDDVLKLKQKREGKKNEGLVERYKWAGELGIGLALGWFIWHHPLSPELPGASTSLPFFKGYLVVPLAGFAGFYVLFTTFILAGTSNAVNLTDGLDGLCAGLCAIAFTTFAVFAWVIGRADASAYLGLFHLRGADELTVFCLAIVGALIGFLWYNTYPAQVFMGDTGSLALGGALGVVAILLKSEFVLAFVGALFAAETLSVIIQKSVFKVRRRRYGLEYAKAHRVFRKAPIHHHFEMLGWAEPQVVVRFWIIGILCALAALSTLKLR